MPFRNLHHAARSLAVMAMALAAILGLTQTAHATLTAGWDFQTTTNGGTALAVAPNTPRVITANFGTGTIYLDGTTGSSSWIAATTGNELTAFAGTATVNTGPGFSASTAGASALALLGGTGNSANGKFVVFKFSMSGLASLVVSYAVQRTGTGFSTHQWDYSTDGISWTSLAPQTITATAFAAVTLPTISGLDNASTAYLRLSGTGASSASGNNRLDNIQFNASTAATPTNPTGLGAANPTPVTAGSATLLTVAVTAGANPATTGHAVTVDLSSIGGSATQTFYDDGSNGDTTVGDGTFSFNATVSSGTTAGAKTLPFTITDTQSRTGSGNISLTVQVPTNPTGIGSASPANVKPGNPTLLKVVVTPGTVPPSTSPTVTADLTAIGGSATQTFYDDGTHGDATLGDNTFSYTATVDPATSLGAKTLPFTVADAQSRSTSSSIALNVVGPQAIVISELRTRGPAGGNDEFVELYNRSCSTVDISGWTLNAANVAVVGLRATIPASTLLPPGRHYLLANTATAGYSGTVTPDTTYSTGIVDAGGVALIDTGSNIVDQVGFASNSAYKEGNTLTPVTSGSADFSYERKPGGLLGNGTDNDDNASDFMFNSAASNPQDLASAPISYYSVSPTSNSVSNAGGSFSVTVTSLTGSGCSWSASSNNAYIHVTSGSTGSDSGTVTYTVDPNTGGARSGSITFGGTNFASSIVIITQDAATPPLASGAAFSPATVPSDTGGNTTLSVTVSAGANPVSSVTADLSTILGGGHTADALSNTGGDNWSLAISVPSLAAATYTATITATDSQGLTGSTTASLTVKDAPAVSITNFSPAAVKQGVDTPTTLTVVVNPGTDAVASVTADLTSILGAGHSADALSNGGSGSTYTLTVTVPSTLAAGGYTVPVTVTDTNGYTASANAGLAVNNAVTVTGVTFSPVALSAGLSTTITVTTTDGTHPAATVTVDLTSVGGTTVTLTGGPNTWTGTVPVAVGTTAGSKSLTVTAADSQGVSSTGTGSLTVNGPGIPLTVGAAIHSSPVSYQGFTYFGDDNGKFWKFENATGNAWSGFPYDTRTVGAGPAAKILGRPSLRVESGVLMAYFVTSDGYLFKVNTTGPTLVWTAPTQVLSTATAVSTTPAVVSTSDGGGPAQDYVFVAAGDGTSASIYKARAADGVLVRTSISLGTDVKSSPAVGAGSLYVGVTGGAAGVLRLNPDDLTVLTGLATGEDASGSPFISSTTDISRPFPVAYVSTDDGSVYATNATNGSAVGSFGTSGVTTLSITPSVGFTALSSSLFVYKNVLYIGANDNKVYAVDSTSGTASVFFDAGGTGQAITSGVVVDPFGQSSTGTLLFGSTNGLYYQVPLAAPSAYSVYGDAGGPLNTTPTIDALSGYSAVGTDNNQAVLHPRF